jgi:hypothetical protein
VSEDELRIMACEEAMIALAAHVAAKDVQAAIGHLQREAVGLSGEELTVKIAAADLLISGLTRWDEFTAGRVFRKLIG